jgi:tetratricopeptide (TPR) repeat protein
MKILTTTALGLLFAASATPLFAQSDYGYRGAPQALPQPKGEQTQGQEQEQGDQKGGIKPSKGALKAMVELQKAIEAKDTANIPAKLSAAQAVATTREDKYILAQFQLKVAAGANDLPSIKSAVDAIAASGLIDNAKTGQLYRGVGGSYYNAKQFDQAAAAFERAVALNPQDFESMKLVGESRLAAGNKTEALAAFQKAMASRKASGQKPEEDLYKRSVQIAYDVKSPDAMQIARDWVAAYPSPTNWHDAVAIYRNMGRPDVEGTLTMLRLLRTAGAMTSAGDYALYASAAADQLNFNEAQAVIDEGIAAKKIDPASAQFREIIPPLQKKPKATPADLAEASKTAQSGMALLRIGDRYYALKDYGKAVELYRKSMGKPGVDADVANLHIGFALTAAGDKAGATEAFKAVKGGRADIAQYWLLYLNGKA